MTHRIAERLKRLAEGTWMPVRDLFRDIHAARQGLTLANRCLQSLIFNGDVEQQRGHRADRVLVRLTITAWEEASNELSPAFSMREST